MRILLDHGARLELKTSCGTALSAAAVYDDTAGLTLLIDRGAKLHARNCHGATPLMLAADAGRIRAIDLLLKKGADINARDRFGRPALSRLLAGDIVVSCVKDHTQASKIQVCKYLIDNGIDIDVPDGLGKTAMYYATIPHKLVGLSAYHGKTIYPDEYKEIAALLKRTGALDLGE